eukprot:COSAG05_NODE_1607_length_4414_cov_2.784241_7_plen_79_part_00
MRATCSAIIPLRCPIDMLGASKIDMEKRGSGPDLVVLPPLRADLVHAGQRVDLRNAADSQTMQVRARAHIGAKAQGEG